MNYPESEMNNTDNNNSDIMDPEEYFIRESVDDLLKSTESETDNDISDEYLEAAVESLLFAYGEPLQINKISEILSLDISKTEKLLDVLIKNYDNDIKRGIYIRKLKDAYTFSTKPEMKNIMHKLFSPKSRPPMTQASYETLAIIAYNQPVTRSQVESVRGVGSDSIISRLAEKGLVHECGTLDAPGRPALFETTELFLKEFGLSSVNDLPPMDMMMYGTLRDIENAITDSSGIVRDNQITIEQIVETFAPRSEMFDNFSKKEVNIEEMDPDEIVNISGALFGTEEEKEEQ